MSQYHFHFYGGGPPGSQNEGIVVSTTPIAQDARLVRSLSHPPPRAPLPFHNISPRPAGAPLGHLSRDRSPRRASSPPHERSPRYEHRSRSRRRHRRHHHARRPEPAEPRAARATYQSMSNQPGPPAPRPASAPRTFACRGTSTSPIFKPCEHKLLHPAERFPSRESCWPKWP